MHNNDKLSPVFNSSLFFKMMFENAEFTGIIIMTPQGTILDVNYGMEKCFGYTKESLVGKDFSVLFIEEDLKKNLPGRELAGTMERGSFNDENFLKTASGAATWVHGESIYAKDEEGREYVVKVIQDINEEKILGQELKLINEEQERIINDRENFIYTASHDLQSPINNIEGLVIALKEKKGDDPEILLAMIDNSIKRFRNKIRELSDIGKVQEEARRSEEVVFQNILEEVLLDLEMEIESSEAEIVSDFSAVPKIHFPKRNLKSVLQNLMSNAVKYRSSDRKLKVKVMTDTVGDDYILLSVTDNGIGIREEDKDRVFQMYERLNTDNQGTGVGMAIVKRIVDNAGGKIELDSVIGEGSIFKIYLPS